MVACAVYPIPHKLPGMRVRQVACNINGTYLVDLNGSLWAMGYDDFGDFIVKFSEPDKTIVGTASQEPLKMEIESFLKCIKENTEPLTSGEEGLKAIKVALAATNI